MINNVTLIGRLTRDAELRYTQTNIATAQFNIACNRNFKNANDEYDADFYQLCDVARTSRTLLQLDKKRDVGWNHRTNSNKKLREPARTACICD